MKQLQTIEDVRLLVDSFYEKVRNDAKLGDIFNERIGDNWPRHLEKMYRFWQTVLLEEQTYFGSPFLPHARLPVGKEHFDRWVELFQQTLDEHFYGEKADEAKWRAIRMSEMFQHKMNYYRNNPSTPLI